MSSADCEIRSYIVARLERAAVGGGCGAPFTDDLNLPESGLLDSYGFIQLLTDVEEAFGVEVDFGELDPQEFTTLGGLVRCLAKVRAAAENQPP